MQRLHTYPELPEVQSRVLLILFSAAAGFLLPRMPVQGSNGVSLPECRKKARKTDVRIPAGPTHLCFIGFYRSFAGNYLSFKVPDSTLPVKARPDYRKDFKHAFHGKRGIKPVSPKPASPLFGEGVPFMMLCLPESASIDVLGSVRFWQDLSCLPESVSIDMLGSVRFWQDLSETGDIGVMFAGISIN